jgi:hypothetical protein
MIQVQFPSVRSRQFLNIQLFVSIISYGKSYPFPGESEQNWQRSAIQKLNTRKKRGICILRPIEIVDRSSQTNMAVYVKFECLETYRIVEMLEIAYVDIGMTPNMIGQSYIRTLKSSRPTLG